MTETLTFHHSLMGLMFDNNHLNNADHVINDSIKTKYFNCKIGII